MYMLRSRSYLKIAFAIGIATVVILSLLPAKSLPSTGVSDKFEHFLAYALLGVIAGCAFPTQRATILLMAVMSTLGIALELGQWFVPGRSPATFDALASGVGACTTLGLCLQLRLRSAGTKANESVEFVATKSSSNSHLPKKTNGRQLDHS